MVFQRRGESEGETERPVADTSLSIQAIHCTPQKSGGGYFAGAREGTGNSLRRGQKHPPSQSRFLSFFSIWQNGKPMGRKMAGGGEGYAQPLLSLHLKIMSELVPGESPFCISRTEPSLVWQDPRSWGSSKCLQSFLLPSPKSNPGETCVHLFLASSDSLFP